VQALDADLDRFAVRHGHVHRAFAHDRRLVLTDLIALRQIGVEVIFPVEYRLEIDAGPEPGSRAPACLTLSLITGSMPGMAASTSATWGGLAPCQSRRQRKLRLRVTGRMDLGPMTASSRRSFPVSFDFCSGALFIYSSKRGGRRGGNSSSAVRSPRWQWISGLDSDNKSPNPDLRPPHRRSPLP
jgi:hypothetical protein